MKKIWLFGTLGLLALSVAANAQPVPVPLVTSIGPNDVFQDIVGGQPSAQSQYAPAPMLGNYAASLPGNNPDNALIGGDATTNLWQRATTGSSVTSTVTYGGPDRWAYLSGTSTAITLSRDSTAADLPPAYQYAFKLARTSGQTGVVQVCMLQEVESVNSYAFQGGTAELDFHAATGSTFSAASANMTAYIITGTGTDEGVAGSASVAFGLNAGGGGSGGWTGQVNWAGVVNLGGVSTIGRYSIAAPIPVGTTEIAVALCFKPVGTAGANDYVAFSGIQLVRNSALTPLVAANASGTATALNPNDTRAKSFNRRSQAIETALQQRYYWQINEPAASIGVGEGGTYETTTICGIPIKNPVTMRAAPTITIGGTAEATTTWAIISKSTTPVALASTYLVQDATIGNSADVTNLSATTASTTAGFACRLVGAGGGANIQASSEL
jgi:hypothetical protein